jgi:hypothetical protein
MLSANAISVEKLSPFDIERLDVYWSHRGLQCTFDVMVEEFGLATEPSKCLSVVLRGT